MRIPMASNPIIRSATRAPCVNVHSRKGSGERLMGIVGMLLGIHTGGVDKKLNIAPMWKKRSADF